MGGVAILAFLAAFITLGLSTWGLFNKSRSFWCGLAGVAVILVSGMGALHAWGESQSVRWTILYLTTGLIGMVSLFRQTRFWKTNQEQARTLRR